MERQTNKRLTTALIWGAGIYYLLTQIDNLFTGNSLQSPLDVLKNGQVKKPKVDSPNLSTTGCTLSKEKLESISRLIEEESETFRNQVFNSSYTETIRYLEGLQTDCDIKALKDTFGTRMIGFTRRFDLDETLNYIFGDGDDIAILNNWFKKNRPNITYQF